MDIGIIYAGNVRIRDNDEREIAEGLYAVGEPNGEER